MTQNVNKFMLIFRLSLFVLRRSGRDAIKEHERDIRCVFVMAVLFES